MARMTGCPLTSARGDSVWGNAWDAAADVVAEVRGASYVVACAAPRTDGARDQPRTTHHAPQSYQAIQQRAHEHHDADDSVGGEKRGVEAREVPGLDQAVLVRDEPCADRHADVIGGPESYGRTERDQGEHREPVHQLRDEDAAGLPEPHHGGMQALHAVEVLVLKRVEDVEPAHPEGH